MLEKYSENLGKCYNKKCFKNIVKTKTMSTSGNVEQEIRFGFCR